jgi:hypothetical protein
MKIANLGLRFLLELCALAALGYWGYHVVQGELARLVLCIAAPTLFAILWGLFAAHKAKFPPPRPWKALVGFLLLECGAVCLALGGQLELAAAFALLIATNTATLELSKR